MAGPSPHRRTFAGHLPLVPFCCSLLLGICGCSRPNYFPDVPLAERYADGATQVAFDLDGDGLADYAQAYRGPSKRVFWFALPQSEAEARLVDWDRLDPARERHLFLILDGVPFDLVAELWSEGHFRLFRRPGLLVSSLPSLTDPAFARAFQAPIPQGYESCYFDRRRNRLTDGARTYLRGENEPWSAALDYRLNFIEDAVMYLFPAGVFRRELEHARRTVLRSKRLHTVIYLLSTDGLGHMRKRSQVLHDLRLLDRWIERLVYDHGARLQVTVFADHGNSFVPTQPFDLRAALRHEGLHVAKSLEHPGDVVLPQFGLIDFAALYVFDRDTLDRVVAVCATQPAIELICYRQRSPEGIVVRRARQRALIRRRKAPPAYAYEMLHGDPLELAPVLERLDRAGLLDGQGFAPDRAWLQRTFQHVFPDPLHRTWEALVENTANPADVVLSLSPGWHVGDPSLDAWVTMEGTHGGLRARSSNTFIMSTAFEVPAYLRPEELLPLIRRTVPFRPRLSPGAPPRAHKQPPPRAQVVR